MPRERGGRFSFLWKFDGGGLYCTHRSESSQSFKRAKDHDLGCRSWPNSLILLVPDPLMSRFADRRSNRFTMRRLVASRENYLPNTQRATGGPF
jgi:hypothetical protein